MSEMQIDLGGGRARRLEVVYPANSNKARAAAATPKPKVEKITTGAVHERKKNVLHRAADSMVAEDGGSVFSYVVMEVLVPAAKNMLSDAVTSAIDRALYGESGRRSGSTRTGSYTNYSTKVTPLRPTREISRTGRARHDFREVVLESRGEAEDVLDSLRNLVDKYEVASVGDLYELVGINTDFTDEKWGWYDLGRARVRQVREGYLLDLPDTQPVE